tara:strand:- start:145 stop:330 length:186 start_codon:yes stop_codon:yes gene_type:complete
MPSHPVPSGTPQARKDKQAKMALRPSFSSFLLACLESGDGVELGKNKLEKTSKLLILRPTN